MSSKIQIYNQAIDYYEHQNYDKAIELFGLLNQNDEILYAIATCYKDKKTLNDLIVSKEMFTTLLNKKSLNNDLKNRVSTNYLSVITLLANCYIVLSNYEKAIEISKIGLTLLKQNSTLNYNIGHLYKCIGKYNEAIRFLKRSMEKDKYHLDTYIELINIYRDLGNRDELLKCINDGITHFDDNPYLYNDLGLFYTSHNNIMALTSFNKALKYGINDTKILTKIYTNIGHLYSLEGNIKNGLENYKKAYEINNDDMIPRQNYLMDLLYLDDMDFKDILKKHLEFGLIIQNHYKLPNFKPNINYNNKKIHIGYVSGDFFGSHPITHFVKCLLEKFNHSEFEIFCYSLSQLETILPYSKDINWRNIKYLTLVDCTNMILNDKIDILIDLSGHTAGNRMDIFSNRLAKIQLSYLGYPCISGMPEIDYHIIDDSFNFNGCKTISMKKCFTHFIPPFIPSSIIQPYFENNYFTFGSFNKAGKINNSVVTLWDNILDIFPNSILIIKKINNLNFRNKNRVKIINLTESYRDYVEQYNQIDISLDTFPYAGTTTTCESLLMGTPVITLSDKNNNTIQQNTTASLLINSGLNKLVASSIKEYIDIIQNTIIEIKNNKFYKNDIQKAFLNGNVTNEQSYISDFEKLIKKLI